MLDVAFSVLADVQLFFENYGWYVLAVVVLTVAVYYKAIRPAVESVKEDKKLKQQKKFDEEVDAANRDRLEAARRRLQEQYNEEAAQARERAEELRRQKAAAAAGTLPKPLKPVKNTGFNPKKFIEDLISSKAVVVFSKTWCPYCKKAKQALSSYRLSTKDYEIVELDEAEQGEAIQNALQQVAGARTVPRVFINGKCIGGGDDTVQAHKNGDLEKLLQESGVEYFS